jgi:protein-S-isoprenylcysteine O-methyltransferase Ste14
MYPMQNVATVKPVRLPNISAARFGDVVLFLFWSAQGTGSLVRAVRHGRDADWLAAAHVATVATILFVSAALFLLRGPAAAGDMRPWPRLIALLGTWSIIPLTALPLTWRPDWLLTGATVAMIAVYGFVLWALLTLRRNLSIFPEARNLVRHGPYALVRHPLYAAHIVSYALICLPRLGIAAVIIAAAGITGEILRSRNEERVLGQAFPDYAGYAATTPRFLPRLSR